MKLVILTLIFCISTEFAISQKQFNNWYFGNKAGISFNTPDREPIILEDGQINTVEGCSAISDSDGNLLFYTDGVTVWNKKHQIMKNGEKLFGHISSSQSAIIVPKPGYIHIYYIFTADADLYAGKEPKGIHYSTVDMFLDNGNGAIVEKNIPVLKTRSEKLTAVIHKNGEDIWVVSQDTDNSNFASFLVTNQGVDLNPVKSPCTLFLNSYQIGIMKFSRNAKKIAVTNTFTINGLSLFDFDNLTGKISNEQIFTLPYEGAYGVEFSRNCKYLYVNIFEQRAEKQNYLLLQFDVTNDDSASIINSMYSIRNTFYYNGALQIGPNNRIYSNSGKYLTVINNPDVKCPACDYRNEEIHLEDFNGNLGLPAEVQGYRNSGIITLCAGNDLILYSNNLIEGNVAWYGPQGFSSNESNPELKSVTPEMSGYYYYKILIQNQIYDYDSIKVNIKPLEKIIFKDTPEIITNSKTYKLKAVDNPQNTKFRWYGIDSDDNEVTLTTSGRYSVVTVNESGCWDSASILVRFVPKYCSGDNIVLDYYLDELENPNASFAYLWNGPNGFTSTDKNPVLENADISMNGDYDVRIIKKIGTGDFLGELDTIYKSIPVIVFGDLGLEIKADKIQLCSGDSTNIAANEIFSEFLWSTGETAPVLNVKEAGIYKLWVWNDFGCQDSAEIEITSYNPKIISDNEKIDFDELCVGIPQTKTITLNIESVDELMISEISTRSTNFELKYSYKIIKKGENYLIEITYNPKEAGTFNDELIIKTTEPCAIVKIIPITGKAKQIIKFTIPEITSVSGEYIEIPINAKIICPAPDNLTSDYELTISVDKEYLKPDSLRFGKIIFNQIIDDKRVIKISSEGEFSKNENEINRIFGQSLVGREEKVQILAGDGKFENPYYYCEYENGTLIVDGCVNNISGLQIYRPTTIQITPNPVHEKIKLSIATQEAGEHVITIINLLGREVFKTKFTKNGKNYEKFEIEINTDDFGTGLYSVKLKSPWKETTDKILIEK